MGISDIKMYNFMYSNQRYQHHRFRNARCLYDDSTEIRKLCMELRKNQYMFWK